MLNWLDRYAFVTAELSLDDGGRLRESVLDVGCGPHGLACAAPHATFAGIDVAFAEPVAPDMVAFRNQPGRLPFCDGAFETVVCLDVLEHVPPSARASFVGELARVSARRVLLACPTDEGRWVEEVLRTAFAAHGVAIPDWLSEHDEYGLPTAAEVAGWCAAPAGFRVRELVMTNGLLSGLTVLGEFLPSTSERAREQWQSSRREWLSLFKSARFGTSHRKGYAIERIEPVGATVDADCFDATLWSALTCVACDEPEVQLRGPVPACRACGHAYMQDTSGAWDLSRGVSPRSSPPMRVADRAEVTELVLAPDGWSRPLDWLAVLSTYTAAVEPERAAKLYLDGRTSDVGPATLRRLIERACDYLTDGSPFASVVLVEGTVDVPAGATPVRTPAEVAELFELDIELDPFAFDGGPREIAEHAVWAKALVDALQADIDRDLYQAALSVPLPARPLVTIRIPTYGSTDPLLTRAIPSVLAGGYEHVEVLVCSDGPQPHAREAVASVADSRVRYLELAERPAYPAWPESFWRSAGVFAANRVLDEARGAFIAPLDHDDAFTHDHITKLMAALERDGADFVYGQAMTEWPLGDWRLHGNVPMVYGEVLHSAVMYSARLGHMRYDAHAWLLDEPGDWNMWRRMQEAGALMTHLAEPIAVHFKERSSIDHRAERQDADVEARAADILGTSARELLLVRARQRVAV